YHLFATERFIFKKIKTMAAELVGGALLSGFMNILFERLASQEVLDFFQEKQLFAKLLNELKITLLSADVLLNDAEQKQLREPNVKKWLEELKEVLYEADHVMDKINTEALRLKLENGESGSKLACKCFNFFPTLFSPFDNAVKSEIEDILGRLNLLLGQTEFLGLKKIDQKAPSQRLFAPLVEECDVFGRKEDKGAIVKLLLDDDISGHRISVIPIVGMGGIGKTTLAQLVFRDGSVKEHFDLKAWVTVSEEFDVFHITKIIFEGITSTKCEIEDLHRLQNELKKALMGKRFFFVHDDVWSENYELWDLLKSSFESGAHGSKIIVTTRNKIVALKMGNVQTYELQLISDDDCWQLFAKHVFNNVGIDAQSELIEIGKQIVRKCKGLPLAVKAMAGLLRSTLNPNEWRRVLQSDIWKLKSQENNTNIIPALWLSYHFLPPHLKRCFAYFSIFPKDYEFRKIEREKIILLWMAEGLLQPENDKRSEDVGEEYLNALISRSFFQQSGWDGLALSMHDLMHDLAMHVSSEFCFVYGGCSDLHNFTSKVHHLSYRKDFKGLIEFEALSKAKYLRSLLALPLSCDHEYYQPLLMQKDLHELFLTAGGCLRTLSLSQSSITELPNSIGSLKHLRYLDLSGTKVRDIPNSICRLYNLQTLLLTDCKELRQLPTNISKLINLRHLMIRYTCFKEMPPNICNMTNLQTLTDYVLCKSDGSRIKELGELQLLHGSLSISGLGNVKNVGDVSKANLKHKKYLSELILRWDNETTNPAQEWEVLNALQPHVNLKELEIIGYKGAILPNWLELPSFINRGDQEGEIFHCLKTFSLDRCRKLKVGLPACYLPSLESIIILKCEEMVAVFPGIPQLDTAYPSLESLHIYSCPRLKSFSGVGLPSSLKLLVIHECNMLLANRMNWNLQRLSLLEDLCLYGPFYDEHEVMDSFPEEGLLPTSLKSLSISNFENLTSLNGKGFQHLTSFQRLDILSCYQLQRLPEEGLPQSLTSLDLSKCPLLSPRCQRRTGEDWPKIQHISRIYIDWIEI
ncbi:NB-ARC domain, LRR domain containing protein, partial [Parasponia andersonii]